MQSQPQQSFATTFSGLEKVVPSEVFQILDEFRIQGAAFRLRVSNNRARGVTERITQWKTSEDGQCVIIVYVKDIVTIDSDEFSEIVQTLFEFSGAQSISLGFSRVKRSPIVNVYRRKP